MESLHDFSVAHWDHEPPLTRPSATLSPSDGERDGVRGRFMESSNHLGDYRAIVELDCPGRFTPGDSGTRIARRRRCVRINCTAWRHDSKEPTSFPFS